MLISKRLRTLLALLFAFMLVAAACGSDDAETDAGTDEGTDTTEAMEEEDDGSDTTEAMEEEEEPMEEGALGTVVVPAGEAVQIRSLDAITGDVAFLGHSQRASHRLRRDRLRPDQRLRRHVGTGLDDLCSAEGGQAAAQPIVADEQVVGVIGTSCSGAATAAAPLISERTAWS